MIERRSAVRARVRAYDPLAEWLLFTPIVGVTFLSKFAFPVGATQISVGFPILVGTVALGLLSGRMQLSPANFALYLATMGLLLAIQVFGGHDFSIPSLALLIMLHVGYAVGIKPGLTRPDIQLKFFQQVAVIIAICGMIQFASQSVIGVENSYPIETRLPAWMVIDRFNYLNPLYFGSTRFKSNGLFMLEPASFCQLLAVATIIELLFYQRLWRFAVFFGGIVVSYSGTGLIVLGPLLPVLLIAKRRYDLLALIVVAGGLAYLASDMLDLDIFARRINEFGNPESSGFARFAGGYYFFAQYLWPDIMAALFGLGAGAAVDYGPRAIYASSELSWVKMIFEFGLVGGGMYFAFLAKCMFVSRRLMLLSLGLLLSFLQNGALIPAIHGLILSLLVWPAAIREAAAVPVSRTSRPAIAALAR